jgi:hypothetical protein
LRYRCRSEPQMAVEVTRRMMSVWGGAEGGSRGVL